MQDKTIRIVPHEKCTGCGACYNKCPKNAIKTEKDCEGFSHPVIDETLCINCSACLNVCPVNQPQYMNESPKCYGLMADDSLRENSSSGGAFILLANEVIAKQGVVCGAAYSEDCYTINHIAVQTYDELKKLQGSKYVQSNTGNIYTQVKDFLDAGRTVLFSGTPCQVAGLKSFLKNDYKNLFTIDIVCHGVPSPALYEQFIREEEEKHHSKAKRVSFRDKTIDGWGVATSIEFENGDVYKAKRNDCPYMKVFLNLGSLRKCCGNCQFAKLPRQGDITLGDFWGIGNYSKELNDGKGTSVILCNNEKGEYLLESIKNKALICKEMPLEYAIKHNAQIKYSSVHHSRRNRFYNLINEYHYSVEKAVDYGLNRRFDIGYVGWWYGLNYGSAITSFAMNRVLKSFGKTVLMLDFPIVGKEVPKQKPNTASRRFAKHFYEESMMYPLSKYGLFNYHCETFLVGSDQLWNWYSNKDVGSYYFFLDFVDNKHKKIAYSTSFGHEYVYYPENMRLKVGYYLSRFDAISVREESAVNVCGRDFGVPSVKTVDPVFLCDKSDYLEAIALSKAELHTPYVLAYILNPDEEKINAVKFVASQKNLPYYIILDGQGDFEKLKKQANDKNVLENLEISDWLKYFYNSEFIVTDSFHGFCFSIIFEKEMIAFPNKLRGLTRFESLARLTGLTERLVYSCDEIKRSCIYNGEIDFNDVKERMEPEISFSRKWLKDALDMRKLPPSENELLRWKMLEFDSVLSQLKQAGLITKNNKLSPTLLDMAKVESPAEEENPDSRANASIKKMKLFVQKALKHIKEMWHKLQKI